MKRMMLVVAAMLSLAGLADNLLGANATVRIVSSNYTEKAWRRDVVMMDDATGEIFNDGGTVSEKAATDAIDTAASNCVIISDAAHASMTNSMEYLYSNTNRMASYCVMTALHVEPETVRSNLTGYVVQTTTTGNYDYQYVWYDRVLVLKPIRFVEYSYYGGKESVKCEWLDWTTNGVSVTVDGKTWTGCHRCKVLRPSFAVGQTCLDLPNDAWGHGASGMLWGDMALRMDGNDLYTGFVTSITVNAGIPTTNVVYFNNGFYSKTPEGAN